jgi:hypothetical protein
MKAPQTTKLLAHLAYTAVVAGILLITNLASAEHKPTLPQTNPFLMPDSIYPMIHWNSAATDITSISGWTGSQVVKPEQVNLHALAWIAAHTPTLVWGHKHFRSLIFSR